MRSLKYFLFLALLMLCSAGISHAQVYPPFPNTGLAANLPTSCPQTGLEYYATDTMVLYRSTVAGNPCTWVTISTGGGAPSGPAGGALSGSFPNPTANDVFVNVTTYGAKPDGSTDASTAITSAFTASNALTQGSPTVYFPCVPGVGCKYVFGGASTSPINPLIVTEIKCANGVELHYTGSAHAADIGPTGLSAPQSPFPHYRVDGCTWTATASATDMVYVTPFTEIEFDHNSCPSTVAMASTLWCMETGGDNYWVSVHDNSCVQINVFANCFKAADSGGDADTQAHFFHNYGGCAQYPSGLACSVASGIAMWVDGVGSEVTGNDFDFMTPDLLLGKNSGDTSVTSNNFETTKTNTPCIQFGTPSSAGTISGLIIKSNFCNAHSTSGAALLGPTNATDLLSNSSVSDNRSNNLPGVLVTLNLVAGQTGNSARGNACGTGAVAQPCTPLHTAASGNSITPENWNVMGNASFADGFTRANGNLAAPWASVDSVTLPSITSNVLGCSSSCGANYTNDVPNNQRNGIQFGTVPTGTDNVAVYSRVLIDAGVHENGYICAYISGTGIELLVQSGGSDTQLGSTYALAVPVAGDWMEIESIGTMQTCYLKGVAIISHNDTTLTAGYAALSFVGTTGKISAFTAKGLP